MIEAAIPRNEENRLEALRALGLLDSLPEKAFDDIVALARLVLGVPTALISLVDSDRQWFKAAWGLDAQETPRSVSFCGHAIHQPDIFVVPDATFDPRFHDNPLVIGEPHIRFYAGFPLTLPSGYRIGTLCALSPVPRGELDAESQAKLRLLGAMTLDAIELRSARQALSDARGTIARHAAAWSSIDVPIVLADTRARIEFCNSSFGLLCVVGDPLGKRIDEALGISPTEWAESLKCGRVASRGLDVQQTSGGLVLYGTGRLVGT